MKAEKVVITGPVPERAEAFAAAMAFCRDAGYRIFEVSQDTLLSQIKAEKEVEEQSLSFGKKSIILCKGGLADYEDVGESVILSPAEARDSYGAVFFVSDGDLCERDALALSRWIGTPHLRVTDKGTLKKELYAFLGIPKPLEIERKFLIEMPDRETLLNDPLCRRVHISQTYLKVTPEEEIRVRARGSGEDCLYYETVKRAVSETVREETEHQISRIRYEELIAEAGKGGMTLEKDRYCLVYDGKYFEIDVYPFSEDLAVMEIELCDADEALRFPPVITIIREVTGEKAYKNATLAKEKSIRSGV